jgi:hypothetical protein
MGLLIFARPLVAALPVLAGCYSPEVRDCTVSCAAPDDCTAGQICGSDRLCAAPERAGHCASPPIDAGRRRGSDAAVPRDAAWRDASPRVNLHVQVDGKGSVFVFGQGTCNSLDAQRGDCTYDIPLNVAQPVYALTIEPNERFSKWTSTTCSTDGEHCTFTPVAGTTITAKFEHNGGPR